MLLSNGVEASAMVAKITKPLILKHAVISIAIPQRLKELQSIFGYFKGVLINSLKATS